MFRSKWRDEDTRPIAIQDGTHTEKTGVAVATVHHLTLEVGSERALAVGTILKGLVTVGTKGNRKHGDVAEHTLQRLVQDVRHLVLEVLRSHKRVEQLATTLNHGVDFTTASAKVRVVVKGLPQVVD